MGEMETEDCSVESRDNSGNESGKVGSIFQRLFAPQSVDTSVSSASDDDESLGSQSNCSTISGSSGESGESSCSSLQSIQLFDRELRAKHRSACKNMTVSDSKKRKWEFLVEKCNLYSLCTFL
jgi:hypothetical protein